MGSRKLSFHVGQGKGAKHRAVRLGAFRGAMQGMSAGSILPVATAETRKAAEGGDAKAQYLMGAACAAGAGIKKNPSAAFHWYEKSANAGCPEGWFGLFSCYHEGLGTAQDDVQAFTCCQRAAELGCPDAIANMGLLLRQGIGCEKDPEKARFWIRQGAEKEIPESMHSLACLLQKDGTPEASAQAFGLFCKAAEQGLAEAQANVAMLLEQGIGCSANPEEAARWWEKAAAAGIPLALYRQGMQLLQGTAGDKKRGLSMLARAASAGCADAEYLLGNLIMSGSVPGRTKDQGIALLQSAAAHGHARAALLLQALNA